MWQELAKVDPPREQLIHLFGTVEKEKTKTDLVCVCAYRVRALEGGRVGGVRHERWNIWSASWSECWSECAGVSVLE